MIVILVGNQKDREEFREVSIRQAHDFKKKHNIPYFIETSAKTGENVENIFTMAAKMLHHNYKDRIAQMVSNLSLSPCLRKNKQRKKSACASVSGTTQVVNRALADNS